MRYISDDGKVFNTETECIDYESEITRKQEERCKMEAEIAKRNELNKIQKDRYNTIQKHKKELIKEIRDYQKDYNSDFSSKLLYELFSN